VTNDPAPAASPGVVLVTGAGGGLGRAFALGFADRGYAVAVADIDAAGAAETARLVEERGARAWHGRLDVTSVASTEEVAAAVADFGGGGIHAVVNNAGLYAGITRAPIEELDPDEWDRVMAVNAKGPWLMTRAASPYLGDGSRVVNIASATVYSGSEHWAHYVSSKSAVIGLTRVMAKELGRRGIAVNAIAPGFTLTEASYGLIEGAEQYGVDRGALRRASQPDDIVGAASFMSGQTLVVDGGRQFI
jgi:NAD(P)-dependent dehydrogenase (short-subunit alcohol dehydrogenase family)